MAFRKIVVPVPGLILLVLVGIVFPCDQILAQEQPLRIAMLLWRGETQAETGFKEGLEELGYSADYTTFNMEQDLKRLGLTLNEISSNIDSYDYIYTFGTTVSRRAKLIIQQRVPQIFNAVTDPVGAGIVDSLVAPGRFISGATDMVPLSLQVERMLETMKISKLGFFFNPREKNSMIIRGELYQLAQQKNFAIVEFRCPPQGKLLEEHLQRLLETPDLVDAVFLPSDSYLGSRADYIGRKLLEAGVASFGSHKEFIESGVLMGIVIDYHRLGQAVAKILDRHQREGSFHYIPVAVPEEYQWLINRATKQVLKVKLPDQVLVRSRYID